MRSSIIGIDQQDICIVLSRLDAIGHYPYRLPIFKIVEVVVIMELCLDMMVRLMSVYVLNNTP